MKFGKFLVIPSLVIALIVAFVIPSKTLAAENNVVDTDLQVKQLSEQEIQQLALELNALYVSENLGTGSENPVIETRGIKSKAALKVAEMLIKSGNKTVNILEDLGLLDAAAMAKSQLPNKLKSWGVKDKGTQQMIANAVSYAIKAADWIFL